MTPTRTWLRVGLRLPAAPGLGHATRTRQLSLNEMMNMYFDGPACAMLGGVVDGAGRHQMWHDPAGGNAPQPWETGYKDTVIAYPGEITRIKARFDLPGLFVWHCHSVEHEDNQVMRPFRVG